MSTGNKLCGVRPLIKLSMKLPIFIMNCLNRRKFNLVTQYRRKMRDEFVERNKELIDSLLKLQELLDTLPDTVEAIPAFTQYIRSFLRIKPTGRTLPTIEMMTIIKRRKPNLYQLFKKHSNDDMLSMLTNLNMDYELAQLKIERILQGEVIA